ncbi:unnamed protein product, partial [Durusdinium trenchii]
MAGMGWAADVGTVQREGVRWLTKVRRILLSPRQAAEGFPGLRKFRLIVLRDVGRFAPEVRRP